MPVSVSEVSAIDTVPTFFTVTICASLVTPTTVSGNTIDVGVSVIAGDPVPVMATVCGEPVALSAMESEAVNAPSATGFISTDTVQLAPEASEVPHVVADLMKDAALVPVMVSEVSVTAVVPAFVTVTTCAAVVDPTTVAANVRLAGDNVTSGAATPVPLSVATCGDPAALSAIDSDAVSAPTASGLNSTDTVQLAPTASEVPHVVADFRNEVALVPVIVSDVSVSAAVPEFFTVTTCAAVVAPSLVEANVRLVGDRVTSGTATPVPVNGTACGEPVALSAIESDAVNAPAASGLNSTDTVHVAPAASEVPQVVADLTKEVAFVPVIVSDVSVSAAVPEFFTVTSCAAVVDPTFVEANVRLVGDKVTVAVAAVPVPLRAAVCGVPVALSATESEAVSAPVAAGLNSTDTAHVALTASEVPQVFAEMTNELALVPVSVSEVSVSAPVPEFFTVTTCAAVVAPSTVDANVSVVGDNVTAGTPVPVPVRVTTCGDPVALSATESEAVSAPAAAGLNSTETAQVALAASEVPQVLAEITNELALVPVSVSEVSVSAAVPEFFTVTTCAAVVAPMLVEANVRLVGDSVTAGAVAAIVPDKATVCVPVPALSVRVSVAVDVPEAAGLNVTAIVQLAPAKTLALLQPPVPVTVSVNALAFVPLRPTLVM